MITKLGKYEWDKAKDVPTNIQALLDDPETEITYRGFGEPRSNTKGYDRYDDNAYKVGRHSKAVLSNDGKTYHVDIPWEGVKKFNKEPFSEDKNVYTARYLPATGGIHKFSLPDDNKLLQHYDAEKWKGIKHMLDNDYQYKDVMYPWDGSKKHLKEKYSDAAFKEIMDDYKNAKWGYPQNRKGGDKYRNAMEHLWEDVGVLN